MEHEERMALAAKACADVWNGGASAMVRAREIDNESGDSDAVELVTRIYTHPSPSAVHECRECGQTYPFQDEANACCRDAGCEEE
jgi:hypothetical protein